MKQQMQIRINKPCQENWHRMSPTDQGRFCMSCQKQVVDFSTMADKEIIQYISTATTSICARAATDQLNRALIVPEPLSKTSWKYWAGMGASLVLINLKITAQEPVMQGEIVRTPQHRISKPPNKIMGKPALPLVRLESLQNIKGKVIDQQGNPVSYASIMVVNKRAGIASDSAGNFVLDCHGDTDSLELVVSSVGYQTTTVRLLPENIQSIRQRSEKDEYILKDIILPQAVMDDVIIKGNNGLCMSRMAGGLTMAIRITPYQKIIRAFKDTLRINEINIYPNPVTRSGVFNIRFNVKDPGNYSLQFIDLLGRIIGGRQINIAAKNQVESFNGRLFEANGMYIVQLTGKQGSRRYSAKLLVQ